MKRSVLLIGTWLVVVAPALAAGARPTDPAAAAPPAPYRSAFEGYQPFREEPIADWKTLNAEVGAAGGHIGIMGGAGGHAGHGGAAKPSAGRPVATEGGQAPVRGAPKAPGDSAQKPAGAAHSQH